jgi:membrane-bound inhibitor of C-type lysozyme
MNKSIVLLALAASLGACSITPEPQGEWTRWVCDSQVEVYWRPDGSLARGVEVRLGAGDMLYHLTPEPSGSGALYSSNVLAFHTKGAEGLLYWVANNDLIGRGCKAPGK